MSKGQKIPHATDLEEKILGALIIDERDLQEAMPIITLPEMFYKEAHVYIFKAIQDLSFNNKPVDLITVSQQLTQMGKLEAVGGSYRLVELTQAVGTARNIETWCRILQQYWLRRKLIKKSMEIQALAFSDENDSLDVLEKDALLNDELNDILFSGSRLKTYEESLEAVVKRVEMLSNQKEGEFSGVPTGLKKVDKFTGGWQNSDLIIEAARPGMGKTSFALKNFVECGIRGVSAGFFSLEMSAEQLTARTVSINSNFHLTQLIRDGFEKPEYFITLKKKQEEMKDFALLIDDSADMDIRDITSRARIWKRKYDIKILFVDYLQLITDRTKTNREQEVSSISRKLKQLAKELNIPVICLSQLSRNVETRGGDKRPKLSDLRESGAIEQDADIVTFHYRPEYYGIDVPEDMEGFCNAEFIFAKYRAGSLGTIDLFFQGDKAKFSDYSPEKYRSENEFTNEEWAKHVPDGDPDVAF